MGEVNFRMKDIKLLFWVSILCTFFMGATRVQGQSMMVGLNTLVTSETTSWTTGGPYGSYINSLAMAQTNPDVIYAGTESGLFKTIDSGYTWTKTDFPEKRVRFVQVTPDNPDIVYAGTDDGVYKSDDGGSIWTQRGLSGARVNAIAIDLLDPNILYAGSGWPFEGKPGEIVGIFKSMDGGETWEEKLSDGLDAVATLLIDTNNSSYIYAGVYNSHSFCKSTDGGETWECKNIVSDSIWGEVVALAMTPANFNPTTIYAIARDEDVYKSADRGETWEATGTHWISSSSPWALAVDANNPNIIYVGTIHSGGCLYKSTDGGDTWSIKVNGLPLLLRGRPSPTSIVIDSQSIAVYVGLSSGGVYKSTDGAESWSWSSQDINNTFIESLAVHPTYSDTVFAAIKGEGHYLAKTTNGGISWDSLVGLPTNIGAVVIDPQNSSIIFAGDGYRYYYSSSDSAYIHKSTDGGQSWSPLNDLIDVSGYFGVSDIWVDPSDSNHLTIAVAGYGVHDCIFGDSGSVCFIHRMYDCSPTTLAADPTDPNIIYLGTAQPGYVYQVPGWTIISPGDDWVWEVRDIEVDLNSQIYVATDSGLWRYDGSDWIKLTNLPTDDITALAVDRFMNPETLYIGTGGQGVFVSQDEGSTWIPLNEGLGNLSITKLTISASQPKMLYAGTAYGGVWSRYTGGAPICGDVSGDGNITAFDAALILQVVVGVLNLGDTEYLTLERADVTGNKIVSALDAALVLQYTVGLITEFPCQQPIAAPALNLEAEPKLLAEAIEQIESVFLSKEGSNVRYNFCYC